jgi:hypothetical protein
VELVKIVPPALTVNPVEPTVFVVSTLSNATIVAVLFIVTGEPTRVLLYCDRMVGFPMGPVTPV